MFSTVRRKSYILTQKLEEEICDLITSEETYIENIGQVVNCYIKEFRSENPLIPIPENLKTLKDSKIFGIIEDIYYWHKDFLLKALKETHYSPMEIASIFIIHSDQFQMYVNYCKSISEYIVVEHQEYFRLICEKFGHSLELSDYLRMPIQRLYMYKLILVNIADTLKQFDDYWDIDMEIAASVIGDIFKNANSNAAAFLIRNYEGDIFDNGELLFDDFLGCEYKGKNAQYYVFLFERSLIFTDCEFRPSGGLDSYKFQFEIPINKTDINILSDKKFLLKSSSPNSECVNVLCFSDDENKLEEWGMEIECQIILTKIEIDKLKFL